MSDYDTGDHGYEGGHEVDYGQYSAGQEHDALSQLHQAHGSEADAHSQFAVYENDHHADEQTDYSTGHHQEIDQPGYLHAESDDYTNYSHSASEDDHVFAAEGSQDSHQAEFSELDALEKRFDAAFIEGTQYHAEGGHGEIAAK